MQTATADHLALVVTQFQSMSDDLASAKSEIQALKLNQPCYGIFTIKVPVEDRNWHTLLTATYEYSSQPFWCGGARFFVKGILRNGRGRNVVDLALGHQREGDSCTASVKVLIKRLNQHPWTPDAPPKALVLSGDVRGWTELDDFGPRRDIFRDDGETYMPVRVFLYVRETCKRVLASRDLANPSWPDCPF